MGVEDMSQHRSHGCPWLAKKSPDVKDPFRLAVFGSRSLGEGNRTKIFDALDRITTFIDYMTVSVGTEGKIKFGKTLKECWTDLWAVRWAEQNWYTRVFHLPEYERYGNDAEFARIDSMVKYITETKKNCLVVFWDGESQNTKRFYDQIIRRAEKDRYQNVLNARFVTLGG